MSRRNLLVVCLCFVLPFLHLRETLVEARNSQPSPTGQAGTYSEYLGRYTDGKDYVVYFEATRFGMTLRPALWTATQLLRQTGMDQFQVVDRASRGAEFHRDTNGRVYAVSINGMEGEGQKLLRAGAPLPVELLLSGNGRAAAKRYLALDVHESERALQLTERVLMRFPSKILDVIQFLKGMRARFSSVAKYHVLLGSAYVAAGNRQSARAEFTSAHQLEPANKDAISGLARLGVLRAVNKDAWTLPFDLARVFDKPTAAEIREVERDWQTRDLSPSSVSEISKTRMKFGNSDFIVRIVSHLVHGERHFGAIIVPVNARPHCCPVIVEAKGVSPSYFPLEVESVQLPQLMGPQQFIYVVPSYRGEVLKFKGTTYQSEGDRSNAWDGATDDALALLNVALEITPEADAARIGAFGRSRGGTVALLMGIRDPRIRVVSAWSGPTDWFELMGTEGWTQQELFAEGMRIRANPEETGGQLIEHFLKKAIERKEDLRSVRHRMLASSPLYFARRLPRLQLHYGMEDPFVPVRNGLTLVSELQRQKVSRNKLEKFFYKNQGHDTDRLLAPELTLEFFSKHLLRRSNSVGG